MHAATSNVTTQAAVLVDGSGGSAERPVRVLVKPASGTIYLGGPDVNSSTHGYPVASTDAAVTIALVGEKLWAVAGSTISVSILASGL